MHQENSSCFGFPSYLQPMQGEPSMFLLKHDRQQEEGIL